MLVNHQSLLVSSLVNGILARKHTLDSFILDPWDVSPLIGIDIHAIPFCGLQNSGVITNCLFAHFPSPQPS